MIVNRISERWVFRCASTVAVVVTLFMVGNASAGSIGVPMTGVGVTETEAKEDAIRKAFDKILEKLHPAHKRKGQSYDWTRRLVAAHPGHVIGGYYKVLETSDRLQNPGSGLWKVRIHIEMPSAVFEAAWQEAEAFIEAIGEPIVGIAMPGDWIEDTRFTPPRRRLDEPSAVAQAIKEALHAQHFNVVILEHKKVLKNSHLEFAKLGAADALVLAELALSQNADLLISADSKTLGPTQSNRTPGRTKWDWEAFCSASIIWSDDASELATLTGEGLGADDNIETGRIVSLKNAGDALANAFLDKVFEQWSDWAYEGQIVTLTALGTNFSATSAIEKSLKKMPGVIKITSRKSSHGVTTIRLRTKSTTYTIAGLLNETEFSRFSLEIDDANLRTIRATATKQ